MNRMQEIRPEAYLGRKTLILGDVNTGKTTLTEQILESLCRMDLGGRIAVVDMAPEVRPLWQNIGACPVSVESCRFRKEEHPLSQWPFQAAPVEFEDGGGGTRKGQDQPAIIERLFRKLDWGLRDILLVNDISMYLQEGTAEILIQKLDGADTVLANGYWGQRLGGEVLPSGKRKGWQNSRPILKIRAAF